MCSYWDTDTSVSIFCLISPVFSFYFVSFISSTSYFSVTSITVKCLLPSSVRGALHNLYLQISLYLYLLTFIQKGRVWRSGNGVGHINEVKLRRARVVLGLVTTFGRSTIPSFIQETQPGHPFVAWCNKYQKWFWPSVGIRWRLMALYTEISL